MNVNKLLDPICRRCQCLQRFRILLQTQGVKGHSPDWNSKSSVNMSPNKHNICICSLIV